MVYRAQFHIIMKFDILRKRLTFTRNHHFSNLVLPLIMTTIFYLSFLVFTERAVKFSSQFPGNIFFCKYFYLRKVKYNYQLKVDSHLPKEIIFICFSERPLKMMKNSFYFVLNVIFFVEIFKFLSWLFDHVEKTAWLER